MNRERTRWGIALVVALLSGCATGANQQLISSQPAKSGRSGGGLLSAFRGRDPMQAQAVPARKLAAGPAGNANDERLVRYFPGMAPRSETSATSRVSGRGMPSPLPGATRAPASPDETTHQVPDDQDDSLSTLPVAVVVSLNQPTRTRSVSSPSPNASAAASDPAPLRELPTFTRTGRDPGVIPVSAEGPAPSDAHPASPVLPSDLSFEKPDAPASAPAEPKAPAPAVNAAPVAEASAMPVSAPVEAPTAAPALSSAPVASSAPAASGPSYVEPMLVVSDPPRSTAVDPLPPVDPPTPEVVPAPPPAPALPAPSPEPAPEPKLEVSPEPAPAATKPPTEAEPAPAATKPAANPDPTALSKPAAPPEVAVVEAERASAPMPSPTLPDSSAGPVNPVVPTVATVASASQAQPAGPAYPPIPSKQLPGMVGPAFAGQPNLGQRSARQPNPGQPTPRPRLLASLWPTWSRPQASQATPPPPPPPMPPTLPSASAPRPSMLASLWPSWLRPQAASTTTTTTAPRPLLAFLQPSPTRTPTAATAVGGGKPVQTASLKPSAVHAHGCPHHACQTGDASPWYGVNRTLETAALFPPTYYETVVKRGNAQPYAAPPAPTLASVKHPAPAAPAVVTPAAPPVPTPSVPTTLATAPQPPAKRVTLLARLWNRIHGTSDTAVSTVPPGPSHVSAAAPPPSPVDPSRNPVTGNLPQHGEPVERVSAERVNEPAQR